ncbi:methionyl-tRNA formyltransferase [Patescibacteria group bacterium]|jgi:methionyl-tRNA formyltransferase|nr:methionyl-tRNA formyltransferase [Patescibacteria group bacterium]
MKYKIVFYGTSPFAVPSLDAVAADGRFEILGVVTQPDRPAGRKGELQKPAVKIAAENLGLAVVQPERVKTDDAYETLKALGGEAAVVASYGQILPQRVLDLYSKGMVNVHASLLPEYRGASPINAAIRDGRDKTGVTIMLMDAQMDHGATLAMAEEPIKPDDTTASLTPRLAELGARILPETLIGYFEGSIKPVQQTHDQATFVKILNREDGKLDGLPTATDMERLVRAMDPWPGTFIEHKGKRLKVLKAKTGRMDGYPVIKAADGSELTLLTIQPEGKKPMDGADFVRGHGF